MPTQCAAPLVVGVWSALYHVFVGVGIPFVGICGIYYWANHIRE